jgi:2-phospho-L-lactate/phosphoenolpyruvate guanylyltransferase
VKAILIPVKRLGRSKGRLAPNLPDAARRRLGMAMLSDILRATQPWSERYVVTADEEVGRIAATFGCRLVHDPGAGLNAAVAAGTAAVVAAGGSTLMVLPADLPGVNARDVAALLESSEQVVIVPSPDGGTNALVRRPPGVIESAFGPQSAGAHLEKAQAAGLSVRTVELDSLRLDVDSYADLVQLSGFDQSLESVRVALEILKAGRD